MSDALLSACKAFLSIVAPEEKVDALKLTRLIDLAEKYIHGASDEKLRQATSALFRTLEVKVTPSLDRHASVEYHFPGVASPLMLLPRVCDAASPLYHASPTFSNSVMSRTSSLFVLRETDNAQLSTDECGTKLVNQYLVSQTIGKGTSGKVKLAYDTERDTTVAIKVLRRETFRTVDKQQQLQREIDVMKRLRHRNLVSLYEVIDDRDSDKLYLVMQYIDDGVLLKIDPNTLTCTPLEMSRATEVARQLVAGLTYLHHHHIVHRDIKPENILQNRDGTVYLCDFGLSEEFVNGAESTVSGWRGSPLFMAPEVHALRNGDSNRPVDGYAADVYSLGVTFYLMLTGRLPYLEGGATHPIDTDALPSEGWTNIVLGMMHPNPQSRLRLKDVRNVVRSIAAFDDSFASPNSRETLNLSNSDDLPKTVRVSRRLALSSSGMSLNRTFDSQSTECLG